MLQQIENICFELRCDKIKTRQKAFVTLYDILNSRASDLQEALRNNEDLSWKSLFSSAHKGITVHCQKLNSGNTELNENDSRISHYSKVLLKICDAATHGKKTNISLPALELTFSKIFRRNSIFSPDVHSVSSSG